MITVSILIFIVLFVGGISLLTNKRDHKDDNIYKSSVKPARDETDY